MELLKDTPIEPTGIQSLGQSWTFRFKDINSAISCYIDRGGVATVAIDFEGFCRDFLVAFDLKAEQAAEGSYFCALCSPSDLYPSLEELWGQHIFDELALWVGRKFQLDMRLALLRYGGGTEAKIMSEPEASRLENVVHLLPLQI